MRAPEMSQDSGAPFRCLHPPLKSDFRTLQRAVVRPVPVAEQPCLFGMGVGIQGLSPNEAILGRPGHARKVQAICSWLNRTYGDGHLVAWAKQHPTRTDISVPDSIQKSWAEYKIYFIVLRKIRFYTRWPHALPTS